MCYDSREIREKFETLGGDMTKIDQWILELETQVQTLEETTKNLRVEDEKIEHSIWVNRREISETLSKFDPKDFEFAKTEEEAATRCFNMQAVLSKVVPLAKETTSLCNQQKNLVHMICKSSATYPKLDLKTVKQLKEKFIESQQQQDDRKRVKVE